MIGLAEVLILMILGFIALLINAMGYYFYKSFKTKRKRAFILEKMGEING